MRLLARLESRMVSWGGGHWNSESFGREARSVPYILCMYRASLVSNVSRDRACETRPWSRGLVSHLVSQGSQRDATLVASGGTKTRSRSKNEDLLPCACETKGGGTLIKNLATLKHNIWYLLCFNVSIIRRSIARGVEYPPMVATI